MLKKLNMPPHPKTLWSALSCRKKEVGKISQEQSADTSVKPNISPL